MTYFFRTNYMDDAIEDLGGIIERAKADLDGVDFDTFVGTGLSGAVVIPALALAMEKHFVLVRKDEDDSHHGGGRLLGTLGARWIFLDDFVSSGKTRHRAFGKVMAEARYLGLTTEHVGDYSYAPTPTSGARGSFATPRHTDTTRAMREYWVTEPPE